ncbi:MAG: hypothetical protein HFE62_05255 [Firmicutes bacterium]|nr:hypothetical protein [Bacillota bacterium]
MRCVNRVRAAARNEVERFPKGNSRACCVNRVKAAAAKPFCEAKFENPQGVNRVRAAARNKVERFPKGNSRACRAPPMVLKIPFLKA